MAKVAPISDARAPQVTRLDPNGLPDPLDDPASARAALQRALGPWFLAARRDLPWRRTRDPYAIWISESMLQQTRVEVVIPYYQRFLRRFPDVGSLARSDERDVLALWSGLGYYSRARALRAAAVVLVERHGGRLPRERAAWLALPGVGPYTAGAVLSIAFSASEPLVDGNVQRVFARLFALQDPVGSSGLARSAWRLAQALVPRAGSELDPGDWNQGLMELGARVCRARTPDCGACPLREHCSAHHQGRVDQLPRPRPRRAVHEVRVEVLVASSQRGLLLERRPASGRMADMLEFPTRELVPAGAAARLWPPAAQADLALRPGEPLGELTHSITVHRIRAVVRAAQVDPRRLPPRTSWSRPAELATAPLTGMARKAVRLAGVRNLLS